MKKIILAAIALLLPFLASAQNKKLEPVYDETLNPLEQIEAAVAKASAEGKFVVCQVGGNWCPWCLKFAAFVNADADITKVIEDNFVFIHVNYKPGKTADAAKAEQNKALQKRLNNFGRFGYPVFVVLDGDGKVIHLQDSSYLEEGDGYSKAKVLSFFKHWTPSAVRG
ncbi:MAG: thioredoxin family protein [Bacteroidales bacterium]|nr:thioredoxin family protein [Bacteroidales bacterium]